MDTLDVAYELDDLDIALEDVFEYLDKHINSTNMFGIAKYIELDYGVSRNTAHKLLSLWLTTKKDRHDD